MTYSNEDVIIQTEQQNLIKIKNGRKRFLNKMWTTSHQSESLANTGVDHIFPLVKTTALRIQRSQSTYASVFFNLTPKLKKLSFLSFFSTFFLNNSPFSFQKISRNSLQECMQTCFSKAMNWFAKLHYFIQVKSPSREGSVKETYRLLSWACTHGRTCSTLKAKKQRLFKWSLLTEKQSLLTVLGFEPRA